ncbi:single-stranded-DNA-specific exonuclease RecJ [Sedimentisphaera salicampi]|uniref:Single-stranded-DNA-specific exonuclease RecJ n=1 Tax=Sedimentisphaera salicampi TaxID=1941349 RepID=A0A1W6LJ93_9BACT|nr:single-stranded-DNA-specific exonuclease RecJ [Sedimentisphaera salicampi]ARN55825.1 Single-stranded-DNA-specific exonuclease RecJ [Sedimentisphaera salicampi]
MKNKLSKIEKKWQVKDVDKEKIKDVCSQLGVTPAVAQVLINRNITEMEEAKKFLKPSLKDLILPERFTQMEEAVEKIVETIKEGKKVFVYGDYDVDGITATSILCRFFDAVGAKYNFYIPHRIEEGYGLNTAALDEIAQSGAALLITVDCGVCSSKEVDYAVQLGMDVVITDHHVPEEKLPEAASAVIHPMLDDYPSPKSCGAMVAMKLAWALCEEYRGSGLSDKQCRDLLLISTDFASLGTVADVMPLTGENRSLISYGLNSLRLSSLPGIRALMNAAGLSGKSLDTFDLSFRISPMLNAAGRMGHARLAVELLTTDNDIRALRIAEYLKEQNNQRKKIEKRILKEASHLISATGLDHPDRRSIIIAGEEWHLGIVGIVASRIIEKFYKPTILLNSDGKLSTGSARTIEGFNILNAINACSDHLVKFGGHSEAAGITIETENLPRFVEDFEEYAKENVSDDILVQKLEIEGWFGIKNFSPKTFQQLEKIAPFGKGNPRPLFAARGIRLEGSPQKIGAAKEHLRFVIRDAGGRMPCVAFKMASYYNKLLESDYFSVAFEPIFNEYNGEKRPQFVIRDFKFD